MKKYTYTTNKEIIQNNVYMKKFLRVLKNKKLFNNNYVNFERYYETIVPRTDAKYINSFLYNVDIPNMFIPVEITYEIYFDIHIDFLKIVLKELVMDFLLKHYSEKFNLSNETVSEITTEIVKRIFTYLKNAISIKEIIIENMTDIIHSYLKCPKAEIYGKLITI